MPRGVKGTAARPEVKHPERIVETVRGWVRVETMDPEDPTKGKSELVEVLLDRYPRAWKMYRVEPRILLREGDSYHHPPIVYPSKIALLYEIWRAAKEGVSSSEEYLLQRVMEARKTLKDRRKALEKATAQAQAEGVSLAALLREEAMNMEHAEAAAYNAEMDCKAAELARKLIHSGPMGGW